LWKHRKVTLRPRYGTLGLIAVPQTWLFQFLLTVIAPLVDLALVWQIAAASLQILQHQDQYDPDSLQRVMVYYLVFLLVDLGSATLALMMERREKLKLAPLLVLQRFGYRQLMYWVVLKALFTAVIGPLVSWGNLDRKSTVKVTA